MDKIFSNGYSIWVEGNEAGICASDEFLLIAPSPYDFVWLWRACNLAGQIPNLASIDLWKVVHATSRDEESPLVMDAKEWAAKQLGEGFKLYEVMTENVPEELVTKIVELIKAGWPIDVEATEDEINHERIVLPKKDRCILSVLFRYERPESICGRYRADVVAYLRSQHVEPDHIDHAMINQWLVEAVHTGWENLGKDVLLAAVIAMALISRAFSGEASDSGPEDKTKIIQLQIKQASQWVAGHYAKPIFLIWRQPIHKAGDLATISKPAVYSFLRKREEEIERNKRR